MKKFIFLIASIIAIAINIFDSYKIFGGQSISYISANSAQSAITPDGFTFAIWGIIFASLLVIGGLNIKNPNLISNKTLGYYLASMLSISLWVIAFQNQIPFLPTILLFSILIFNLLVSFQLQSKIKHVYLIYTSWTIIACVINFAVMLQYDLGLKNIFNIPNSLTAIVVLGIGAIIYFLTSIKFKSITPLLVGAWAFWGINRVSASIQPNQDIKIGAIIYSLIMLVGAIVMTYQYYIFKNQKLKIHN